MRTGHLLLISAAIVACFVAAVLLFARSQGAFDPAGPYGGARTETAPSHELHDVDAPAGRTREAGEPTASKVAPATATTSAPKPTHRLAVRVVRAEDGEPIADAHVGLALSPGVRGPLPEPRTTDARGDAELSGIEDGFYDLVASAPGRAVKKREVVFFRGGPDRPIEVRLEFQRDVLVRLVDARGTDLSPTDFGLAHDTDVGIGIALGARCGAAGARFESGEVPTYRSSWIDSKTQPFTWKLQILGRDSGCVHALFGDVVVAAQALDERATEIAVVLDREAWNRALGPVVVRVVDDVHREPVAGARIAFACGSGDETVRDADAEGRVQLDDVPCGQLVLQVRGPGYATQRVPVRRPVRAEVVVRLRPARRIDGVLRDLEGRPIAGVAVLVWTERAIGEARSSGTVASPLAGRATSADGTFSFDELAADEYMVGWNADGSRRMPPPNADDAFAAADCTRGDAVGIVLRGARATPR